jgi:hypothetical protein
MSLLNVSFGIFAFMPQGWLFMAFVIFCECFIVSKLLIKKWKNGKIYLAVGGTNIISGLLGIIVSMLLNGGWYLVVWFPWVSSNEINLSLTSEQIGLIIFYIICFIISLVVETNTNILFLKKRYEKKEIIKATVIANIVTYIVGSALLYSYSFGLF